MRKVCSACLSIAHLSAGDILFQPGEPCHHVYFIQSGSLKYYPKGSPELRDPRSLVESQMESEDVLEHEVSGAWNMKRFQRQSTAGYKPQSTFGAESSVENADA